MPVSASAVAAAIRLLLDREPESPLELGAIAAQCADMPALRRHLLASEEFERLHPDLARAEAHAPVVVTLDDGVRIVVDLSDHAVGVPIARRMFERNELDFVTRTVRAGQHVVDGGAHAGLYAFTMARLVGPSGSVHAFEPVEAHVGLARRRGPREPGRVDRARRPRRAVGSVRHRGGRRREQDVQSRGRTSARRDRDAATRSRGRSSAHHRARRGGRAPSGRLREAGCRGGGSARPAGRDASAAQRSAGRARRTARRPPSAACRAQPSTRCSSGCAGSATFRTSSARAEPGPS